MESFVPPPEMVEEVDFTESYVPPPPEMVEEVEEPVEEDTAEPEQEAGEAKIQPAEEGPVQEPTVDSQRCG